MTVVTVLRTKTKQVVAVAGTTGAAKQVQSKRRFGTIPRMHRSFDCCGVDLLGFVKAVPADDEPVSQNLGIRFIRAGDAAHIRM